MSILEVAPELQSRVRSRIEEVSRRTGIYIKRLELSYDLKTATTLGEARYGYTSYIRLNPAYLNTLTDWYLEHICCHEYLHLGAMRRHGVDVAQHGAEWRALMLKAGVEPIRAYDVELPAWVEVGPRQRIKDQPMRPL